MRHPLWTQRLPATSLKELPVWGQLGHHEILDEKYLSAPAICPQPEAGGAGQRDGEAGNTEEDL